MSSTRHVLVVAAPQSRRQEVPLLDDPNIAVEVGGHARVDPPRREPHPGEHGSRVELPDVEDAVLSERDQLERGEVGPDDLRRPLELHSLADLEHLSDLPLRGNDTGLAQAAISYADLPVGALDQIETVTGTGGR